MKGLRNPENRAFPAKAGIHASSTRSVDKWVPAFAGTEGVGCVRVPDRYSTTMRGAARRAGVSPDTFSQTRAAIARKVAA
jgi:hypothetical protein